MSQTKTFCMLISSVYDNYVFNILKIMLRQSPQDCKQEKFLKADNTQGR